jgi:L-arabonate dehydrase
MLFLSFQVIYSGCCTIADIAPEAAVGGPLALVRTGDEIELDVDARRLQLMIDDEELECRLVLWEPPTLVERGYTRLYQEHVLQADKGCDLDFLRK